METVWQWGIDTIHTVQLMHGPVLDAIFEAITFMGNEEFFLILLPLIFWCVDFAVGSVLEVGQGVAGLLRLDKFGKLE